MSSETSDAMVSLEKLSERASCLTLEKCRQCGVYWYIACDEEEDDYYLQKLNQQEVNKILSYNVWPSTFDNNPFVGTRCSGEIYWKFIRGDLSFQKLKQLLVIIHYFSMPLDLERQITKCYDENNTVQDLDKLKLLLIQWLDQEYPRKCNCITWKNNTTIPVGQSPCLITKNIK